MTRRVLFWGRFDPGYSRNRVYAALFRELGPVVTAVILAGRTGSAFAAEIGTMKTNEELDALTTMGLAPVRFLVLPRVMAAAAAMPVLTTAKGCNAELFSGFIENTDIAKAIKAFYE